MNEENIKLIPNCIKSATLNTFKVQLSSEAQIVKVGLSMNDLQWEKINCVSSLVMDSEKFIGTLTMGMSSPTLLNIIERLTGEKYSDVTPENSDAAGELLNIIYSSARKEFNAGGFNFSPSLPSTIIGTDLRLSLSSSTEKMIFFECDSTFGKFSLVLTLRTKKSTDT